MDKFNLEKNELNFENFDSKNLELIKSLITCKDLLEHKETLPKVIALLDSIQRYVDLKNEQTRESMIRIKEYEMIDLASKSSDLTHKQSMQKLLIDSINSNNLTKANFVHCILNNKSIDASNLNNSTKNFPKAQISLASNNANLINQNIMKPNSINNHNNTQSFKATTNQTNKPISNSIHDSNMNKSTNNITPTKPTNLSSNNLNNSQQGKNLNGTNDMNMSVNGQMEDEDIEYLPEESFNQQMNASPLKSFNQTMHGSENNINSQNFTFNHRKLSKVLLMNQKTPYRHIICSNGLELSAKKFNILVLFKGRCNGNCYSNKPWATIEHFHYIVNCTDCNDHVSRLVKKCGIEFYNSFLIDNVERQNQLRHMYNMQKIN